MKPPAASVVMSAFNRAAFVAEAIESVLAQSFDDFEFLIADDASTDGTRDVIASFDDPRITFEALPVNLGYPESYNALIRRCSGRYVAIMDSDDAWLPSKLERQITFLEAAPEYGAAFGQMHYVDTSGNLLPEQPYLTDRDLDLPAGWWLRRFMVAGTCFIHPTAVIRTEVLRQIGLYDPRLKIGPDFDLWRRMVHQRRVYVFSDVFLRYRWQLGHNLSQQGTAESVHQQRFALDVIARHMLDGASDDTLLGGFGDLLLHDVGSDQLRAIESAFLQVREELPASSKQSGLSTIFHMLDSPPLRDALQARYQVTERTFQDLSAAVGPDGVPGDRLFELLGLARRSMTSPDIEPAVQLGKECSEAPEPSSLDQVRQHQRDEDLDPEQWSTVRTAPDWAETMFSRSLEAFGEGALDEGQSACDRLLCLNGLRREYRDATHANMRFYARPLEQLMDTETTSLNANATLVGVELDQPTLMADSDSLIVISRATTAVCHGLPDSSKLWLQRYSSDLEPLEDALPIRLPQDSSLDNLLRSELADLRLVRCGHSCIGTAMLSIPDLASRPILSVVELDIVNGEITGLHPIGNTLSSIREPGAMPVSVDDALFVVQQSGPAVVLRADMGRNRFVLEAAYPAPRLCEWFRGGSQLCPHEDGYLGVVYEDIDAGDVQQHLHRLVRLDQHLRVSHMSHPFMLRGVGAETCHGFASVGKSALISFTADDGSSFLIKVKFEDLASLLKPIWWFLSDGLASWPHGCVVPGRRQGARLSSRD